MRQGVFNPKLKLLWHCDRVHKWLSGENIAPIMVEMDLTNRCQLKCDFCTFKYIKDRSDIPRNSAICALFEMSRMGVKAVNFTGGGEPTLHKDFNLILLYAKDFGLDIGLFTNGYNVSLSTADTILQTCRWVRVSVDTHDGKTSKEIKGVANSFRNAIKSINLLICRKEYIGSDTDIGVGYVITPKNYMHIEDFVEELSREKIPEKVRYIQFKPMIDNLFEDSHIESTWWNDEVKPRLDRVMTKYPNVVINLYKFNDLVSDIEREYDICYGHNFSPCIGATGDVWVCTHLRDIDGFSLGNINTQSFKEIWNSEKRKEVIKKIDLKKCQKYCRNNEINKVLYQLKHGGAEGHYNFI